MALVGHISGSTQTQSVIGVTGSVVFANQPAASFPTLSGVGSDAVFFVSGSIGGKAAGTEKTVAVFGGDTVISGSLTVGTGSVKITSNDIQFSGFGNRIELVGSDLKFYDATNPAGFTLTSLSSGGGGGPTYWSSISANEIYTTGSVVASGSLTVKNGAGAAAFIATTTGDVTGSSFNVTGGSVTTTQTTFNLVNEVATTVNFAGAATQTNIGNAAGVVAVAGALQAGGGFGDTGVTLSGAGNVRANGFLQVDGESWLTGSVTLAGNSQTVTHTGTGNLTISSTAGSVLVEGTTFTINDVTVAGDLAVNGGDLTTTATSFNLLAGATSAITVGTTTTRVSIPGDLYVQGSVTAIESTNTKIKDNLVILGSGSAGPSAPSAIAFASGSTTANQSLVFGAGVGQDILAAVKADVQDGTAALSAGTYSSYVPVRGSKFELAGPTAFITSSNGTDFQAQGAAASMTSTSGLASIVGGIGIGLNAQANNISFQNNSSTVMRVSGSGVSGATLDVKGGASTTTANFFADVGSTVTTMNFGTSTGNAVFGGDVAVNGGDLTTSATTFNLVNATATTVNFAGGATLLNMGTTAGSTLISGSVTLPGSLGVQGLTSLSGSVVLGDAIGDNVTFVGRVKSSVIPALDVTYDLGSSTNRWANMYTGDLHLKNDRGDWTIIEEPDFLTITNNRNGKRYKFVMEEIG